MGKPQLFCTDSLTRKNILFLTLRADFGGGPEHLWQLLQNMPSDVTACIVCPEDYPYHDRYRRLVGDINVFTLPHRAFSLHRLWQLQSFCRERGVSVLHSHGKGAGLYARLLVLLIGLPCVHTFHGVHVGGYGPWKKRAYRLYERCMSLLTRVGITVSAGERQQIVSEGLMPESKLRLIPNGVEIPAVSSAKKLCTPPYTIISMSRFDYQKNSIFLVDICHALGQRLADFRILLLGVGQDREAILNRAQAEDFLEVLQCPGAVDNPQFFLPEAFCYLSTSRWEGMPLAVLEAMAHGLPVVLSDVVGNRDVVTDGHTGFLYPEGNAVAAAAALCRLADEPELYRVMAEAAEAYVRRNHDARSMALQTFEILRAYCLE